MFKLMLDILQIYQECVNKKSDINQHLEIIKSYSEKCESISEVGGTSDSFWSFLIARPKTIIIYSKEKTSNQMEKYAKIVCVEYKNKQLTDEEPVFFENTDLLFLDYNHTYLGTISQLSKYSVKVNKYIILAKTEVFGYLDEFFTGNNKIGMFPAIEEFILNSNKKWKIKEIRYNNLGLVVLEKI